MRRQRLSIYRGGGSRDDYQSAAADFNHDFELFTVDGWRVVAMASPESDVLVVVWESAPAAKEDGRG